MTNNDEYNSLLNMCDKATMYALDNLMQEIIDRKFTTADECIALMFSMARALEDQIEQRGQIDDNI